MSSARSRADEVDYARTVSSRTYAVFAWVIVALFEISFVASGGIGDLLRYGAYPLLVAALAWAVFWQPAVAVGPRSVTLVNVINSVTIPYHRITDISTRWGLGIEAGGKVYTSWAAPARTVWNRRKATAAAAAADEGLPGGSSVHAASRGEAIGPGELRVHADADSLAAAIRARMALAAADDSPATPETVTAVGNTRELLIVALAAALCVATMLLT